MSQKLRGKVAIVTGASKGIGASIALHLANEGAAVVVNYATSKAGADRVVGEIVRMGGKAIAVQANLAKEADIERLFSETKNAFGKLDILVNNAGIYEFAPLENVTAEHFHKHFDLNVLGLILASQQAAGCAHGTYAGQSAEAFDQFPQRHLRTRERRAHPGRETRHGEIEVRRQQMVRL